MKSLLALLRTDLAFLRGHTLQPGWFKAAKVLLLLAALAGGWILFGPGRTLLFLGIFLLLSLGVHFVYRVRTRTWTVSWLDFKVMARDGRREYGRIGAYYYTAVALNALMAFLLSGWLLPR